MSKVYDVVAANGEYTDNNTGEQKVRWINCGAVFKTDKGLSLKLEAVPIGEFNGWFKLFEPKQRGQQAQRPAREPGSDDAPFNDDPGF